jgi:biopolymer transport protein ExbD
MNQSALNQKKSNSPLARSQNLKGGEAKKRSRGEVNLPLTALIDAFSIIVIYLLIGTQNAGPENGIPGNIQLPTAELSATFEEAPVVRIEKGLYFIDDVQIAQSQLGQKLFELKKKSAKPEDMQVLIQADQKMDYAQLDPLLKAGSEAGIQKIKFAVVPTK